jgi:membrane protein YqaA with SNARE-associated domain
MRFASTVFALVMKFGGIGLLALGVLDSSFLIAPWGNDLLVIAMTARHPSLPYMIYCAAMSTAGSVLGCLLIDLTLRPLGAKGLEKHLSKRRLERVRKKMGQDAGVGLALASLAPPPFPFTAFVMAAAALQYSRKRLLAVVGATRMIRFTLLGALAMRFGERILRWGANPIAQGIMVGLIVFSIVGSVVSVYGWIKRSKTRETSINPGSR